MDLTKCPYCHEDIPGEAVLCEHCQSELPPVALKTDPIKREKGFWGGKSFKLYVGVIFIVVIALLVFFIKMEIDKALYIKKHGMPTNFEIAYLIGKSIPEAKVLLGNPDREMEPSPSGSFETHYAEKQISLHTFENGGSARIQCVEVWGGSTKIIKGVKIGDPVSAVRGLLQDCNTDFYFDDQVNDAWGMSYMDELFLVHFIFSEEDGYVSSALVKLSDS